MSKTTLKKKVWTEFSKFIRLRDCLKTTGNINRGRCITCGREYPFKKLQAGHFIGGRHNSVLYNEHCVHAQCYYCNITLKGNTLEYRRKIIEMYGEGDDIKLEEIGKMKVQYKTYELEALLEEYKTKSYNLIHRVGYDY